MMPSQHISCHVDLRCSEILTFSVILLMYGHIKQIMTGLGGNRQIYLP